MADLTSPLAPLSPELVQSLGEPQTVVVGVEGRLDRRALAWPLGVGVVATGGASSKRETTVEIWLLPTGVLLTNVAVRQTHDGGSELLSHGQFHETPQGALDWLINDGKGKLGSASKQAWLQACSRFAPMGEMAVSDVPGDPGAIAGAMNQELPLALTLSAADGTSKIVVEFCGPFRISGSNCERPFIWLDGPKGLPGRGSLKISFAACSELVGGGPSARWDRVHRALRHKYVLAPAVFFGEDGNMTLTASDLKL